MTQEKPQTKNPLLLEWTGPYDGVPPFDQVKVTDFRPALEEAMAQHRAEIEAITRQTEPATFENTILKYEKSGETLSRVDAVYGVWGSNLSSPEFREIEKEFAPKLAALDDEVIQNKALYQRIKDVDASEAKKNLTPEQQRLVWYHLTHFELHGARLSGEQKKRVAEINQKLAQLTTLFSQNLLADEENDFLVLKHKKDLAGLPPSLVEAAAEEAQRRHLKNQWVIANTRSSMEPFLTYSSRRDLREKAFRMWISRGDQGNKNDNNKIVREILELRHERSKLLGYQTFAHWHLTDMMAKEPSQALDLMMKVWRPAVARVKEEVADMQAIVDGEKGGFKIQPWDYRYYSEKVRKAKYDLDLAAVRPYLQLDHIREAMFWAAGRVFGLEFVPVHDVKTFHKDVTVYKVLRQNKLVGLWYFDPYARPGKRSGAWMTAYREQRRLNDHPQITLVSNNSNFMKTKPGEPVLLSWDDAVTMFHEFGHALHGLSSEVTYPSLSGTLVARDFVEFPSQFFENYVTTTEVFQRLVDSRGRSLPKELVEKLKRSKVFNQGFTTVEYLASAIVDMKLHLSDGKLDPKTFEKTTLQELGMPAEVVMRHRIPQFSHLFSDEEYAAGYYGYLWAQVLDFDAFAAFEETGNPYSPEVAEKLRKYVFSVGNTEDPAQAYRKFRGRHAKVFALLQARGFPTSVAGQVGGAGDAGDAGNPRQ
ncbi:MAG: peptidase M3 [Bdellovibrio sp.]|nr:MAG: peptidase M3 [Bdellovibrio sp.]